MSKREAISEMHGCVVCGKLYQLYVVYDATGKCHDFRVTSENARPVKHGHRPLVACKTHSDDQIKGALIKSYGPQDEEDG
jgi:hypothetical protein